MLGLLLLVLGFPRVASKQELYLGGSVGSGLLTDRFEILTLSAALEYRPHKAMISLNTDPGILWYKNEFMLTVPLYVKLIIGRTFRCSPSIGGFVRTNKNIGMQTGLALEYQLNSGILVFGKG